MKSVLVVVIALCAVAYALPRPAEKEDSDETEDYSPPRRTGLFYVPLERSFPRRPFQFTLTDDLVPPPANQNPFFRSGNPWGPAAERDPLTDDFYTQMQGVLADMRRQLTELLHKKPVFPDGEGEVEGVGTRIGASDDDVPKNKTTSTTKVIDGHVVTVNETTYSSGDDNIGAVFRVKIVEVHPSETPETEVEGETESEAEPVKPEESFVPEQEPTTSRSELEADTNEETNEIPNAKVGSEVDDLNA